MIKYEDQKEVLKKILRLVNLYNMFTERQFRLARKWSNKELSKFAHLFDGNVVNVSGWIDADKEGGWYKDYFINKRTYSVTNNRGYRGFQNIPGEIYLDLAKDLPDKLYEKFDVAFNHTTFEHIYEVRKAFTNFCAMTRDIAIVVVPFSQVEHTSSSFGDYWRFTPMCMRQLFEENGMTILYESANDNKKSAIYLFYLATKSPEKWNALNKQFIQKPVGNTIGYSSFNNLVNKLKNAVVRLKNRINNSFSTQQQ
jgi:hypothetical protein